VAPMRTDVGRKRTKVYGPERNSGPGMMVSGPSDSGRGGCLRVHGFGAPSA